MYNVMIVIRSEKHNEGTGSHRLLAFASPLPASNAQHQTAQHRFAPAPPRPPKQPSKAQPERRGLLLLLLLLVVVCVGGCYA